jgi:hypothetical protein
VPLRWRVAGAALGLSTAKVMHYVKVARQPLSLDSPAFKSNSKVSEPATQLLVDTLAADMDDLSEDDIAKVGGGCLDRMERDRVS